MTSTTSATLKRALTNVYAPPAQPGFLGAGHIARPVIQIPFSDSDPFIMLMDDMLDKKDDIPVGGPHPHAGFETVSLLLEGELGEGPHAMKAGDLEIMTAGSGIIHTETIAKKMKMRLLQLWLNLPKEKRQALPRIQRLSSANVPQRTVGDNTIRVYSGSFADLMSPIQNHTPMILADVTMKPGSSLTGMLPANFSTFIYVIDGGVQVGEEGKMISQNEVGWLDRYNEGGDSELMLMADDAGARFILYSGEPQKHEIVSHGPFIADSMEDIRQLYADFRQGKMGHISEVSAEQRFLY